MTRGTWGRSHRLAAWGILLLACACRPTPPQSPKTLYVGPTLRLADLVSAVNQNNTEITSLWALVDNFKIWFVDPKTHETHYADGDGSLVYSQPDSIRFTADNTMYPLFDLGSNGEKFWFWLKKNGEVWSGTYSAHDRFDATDVPVPPDLVLEVRFDNEDDAYMVVWQEHRPDRWVAEKEIWYDRQTLLPKLVKLYDADGRVELRADLSVPGQIEVKGQPREQWPRMATHFELFFPPSGAKMSFDLSKMALWLSQAGQFQDAGLGFERKGPRDQ